ncbi:hypothetical protein [Hypericibacter sp.]|uniref:hypothetical protein n=1 Tax=Hypericibacter sp. TaxID=2705401 RepID=UPI003D6CCEB9
MTSTARSLRFGTLASVLLAAALAAAPIGFGINGHWVDGAAAFAKNGGGGGNGNGNGNGNGGGNGNGAGNANGASKNANAGKGLSSATDDESAPGNHGALASSLGALNAANASTKALDKANPNSRVGRIATYGKVVAAEDTLADPNASTEDKAAAQSLLEGLGLADLTAEQAERASLEDAANKTVTDKVMDAVNDMLGL